jgi:hypothetical protein
MMTLSTVATGPYLVAFRYFQGSPGVQRPRLDTSSPPIVEGNGEDEARRAQIDEFN